MTVEELINELDDHGFEDTSEERKLAVINDTLWDIESREDWNWLIFNTNLTFDGSSATPTNLPASFKAVKWLYDTTLGISLHHMRLEEFRDRYQKQINDSGDAALYYFVGNTMKLWPTPPASSTRYTMDYYSFQTEVTALSAEAAILLPPRHHRTIVLGAVAKLYQLEDDPELAAVFKQDYEQRIATLMHDTQKKQFTTPDRIFVIDEDDEWQYPFPL